MRRSILSPSLLLGTVLLLRRRPTGSPLSQRILGDRLTLPRSLQPDPPWTAVIPSSEHRSRRHPWATETRSCLLAYAASHGTARRPLRPRRRPAPCGRAGCRDATRLDLRQLVCCPGLGPPPPRRKARLRAGSHPRSAT